MFQSFPWNEWQSPWRQRGRVSHEPPSYPKDSFRGWRVRRGTLFFRLLLPFRGCSTPRRGFHHLDAACHSMTGGGAPGTSQRCGVDATRDGKTDNPQDDTASRQEEVDWHGAPPAIEGRWDGNHRRCETREGRKQGPPPFRHLQGAEEEDERWSPDKWWEGNRGRRRRMMYSSRGRRD